MSSIQKDTRLLMSYEESIEWLNCFQRFGIKLGLERIKFLCEKLDNPQDKYNIIHVGGTNGKGSVCKFISSILERSGYNTGLYLSPHLQRFSERISINGKEISEEEISYLISKIKPIVEEMKENGDPPTYFEIVTAMAFQYFYEKNVDFAVVEVGLGGRFDATNIVNPVLTVITNVSPDHQNILGRRIKDIAFEKAGIIKEGSKTITGTEGVALKIIKDIAKQRHTELVIVKDKDYKRISCNLYGQEFLIKGILKDYNVKTKMLGEFQGKNIAISVAAIESLQLNGFYIPDEGIEKGLEEMSFAGRIEIIQENPLILLDGAHNIAGIKALTETIKKDFPYDKLILVIGILSDKRIVDIFKIILPIADFVILTKSSNERACDPLRLKDIVESIDTRKNITVKERINEAIEFARSIAGENDLICITGSLYTVGEARDFLTINKY